jgi:endonuclease/exonuclease/phosphatase family metal-dependent hydrolase
MIFTNVLNVPPWKEKECMRRPIMQGSDVVQFDNMPLFFEVLEEVRRRHAGPPQKVEYLCPDARDPEAAEDKVNIDCRLESGEFAPPVKGPANGLKVVAYNMERGMYLDGQAAVLDNHPDMRDADVILISEADRYCSRVSYRNVARELARKLEMNYVFGVQYVELPRKAEEPVNKIETVCEHGNAVLSRYPIKNARRIQHRDSVNWYVPPAEERDGAEPRLGGAITIAADIDLGDRTVTVYSVHLSSNIQKEAIQARTSQAKELVSDAAEIRHPVIMGGDFNTIAYTIDTATGTKTDGAVNAMQDGGFVDAHSGLPRGERGTTGRDYLVRGVIDLIFVRGMEVVESGRCGPPTCGHLSDHLPVWTKLRSD